MAASGSSRRRSPWPDLPAELLGLVLMRLPSHADRVRLPAVCRAWRSAAKATAPPPLPWLALPDGTFLSLPDDAVHRLPVPDDVFSGFSTGGALFLMHEDGSFSLMCSSSAATVDLPEPRFWFSGHTMSKVVVSDHLVAVLDNSWVAVYTRGGGDLAAGASTTCMAWTSPAHKSIADIALFQGKLYVLTREEELHVLDAGDPHITNICCIRKTLTPSPEDHDLDHIWNGDYYGPDMHIRQDYLVVAGNQLLRVELTTIIPATICQPWTYQFHVYEAADLSCGDGRWRDVSTLMGRALSVSQSCSESVPAAAGNQCGRTGVQEDCIYFVSKNDTMSSDSCRNTSRENPFLDSGVYNMRDRIVSPLPLETSAASTLSTCDGMWAPACLFPKT
ncbi:hypothetical protein ZWY2020_046867 [Hordeum vulgare]|nr:hypothetical protein ZWY2020_046867 [Hordeum vulgare]